MTTVFDATARQFGVLISMCYRVGQAGVWLRTGRTQHGVQPRSLGAFLAVAVNGLNALLVVDKRLYDKDWLSAIMLLLISGWRAHTSVVSDDNRSQADRAESDDFIVWMADAMD